MVAIKSSIRLTEEISDTDDLWVEIGKIVKPLIILSESQ